MSVELEERVEEDVVIVTDDDVACQTVWEVGCPREVRWICTWTCCNGQQLLCDEHKRRWHAREELLQEKRARLRQTFPGLFEGDPLCPRCGRPSPVPTWRPV